MEKYIKFSIIEAKPCTWGEFMDEQALSDSHKLSDEEANEAGYDVCQNGWNHLWSDKETFEKEYLFKLTPENTITKDMVDDIIESWQHTILNDENEQPKTVVVMARLKNGFVIVESSNCVDPKNFDFNTGFDVCVRRIHDKIWELSGFVLQNVQFLVEVDKTVNGNAE